MKMGITEDVIDTAFDILSGGEAVCFMGPSGCGKSLSAMPGGILHTRLARYHGIDPSEYGHIDHRPSMSDPTEAVGLPYPNIETGKTQRFLPDNLPTDPDSCGIFVIEEITRATKPWCDALYQFVNERRLGDYFLPDGWSIMATGNRVQDGCGATTLPSALRDRFFDLEYLPSQPDWDKWAIEHGVDYRVIAATRWHPHFVEAFDGKIKGQQSTGRSLTKFSRIFKSSGMAPSKLGESPEDRRIDRLAIAKLGGEDGGLMSGFIKIFAKLPDIDNIVKGCSESVSVPTLADVEVATVAHLAKVSNDSNIGNILRWIDRNKDTMKIIFAYDVESTSPMARDTKEYRDWRIANDVLFN
jgi:hypothetical protein